MDAVKKVFAGLILITFSLTGAIAQRSVTEFLDIGIADAKILTEAYLAPYGDMLGRSLNGGWYNSADVHKVGGFNFTVGINMSMVPSASKSFDVAALLPKLSAPYALKVPANHVAPTLAGSMLARPVLTLAGNDVLTLPDGSGFDKFPMPMVQVGIGLPLRTEVTARFVPRVNIPDAGKIQLLGFGIKHSIKEYIPGIKRVPFLSSSVMVGYTSFDSEVGVAYRLGTNQSLNISSTGFTGRFLIGANLPVIAVYTGVGYSSAASNFALKGDYTIGGSNFYNPLSLDYTSSGFTANAGVRLRLGFIALHGDYTLGEYPMVTAGFGLSFR